MIEYSPLKGLIDWFKEFFCKYKGCILLTGQQESGKDTLLSILLGKGFPQEHRATIKEEEHKNSGYKIINIPGNSKALKEKERLKNNLQELKKSKPNINIIYVYMFDVSDFIKDNKLIMAQIQNAKKESDERNFIAKIIGTRGDMTEKKEQLKIENKLRNEGYDAIIFDMTKISKDEAFNFLERA